MILVSQSFKCTKNLQKASKPQGSKSLSSLAAMRWLRTYKMGIKMSRRMVICGPATLVWKAFEHHFWFSRQTRSWQRTRKRQWSWNKNFQVPGLKKALRLKEDSWGWTEFLPLLFQWVVAFLLTTTLVPLRQDIFTVKFLRAASVSHANKYETEWLNMPHIKVSRGGKDDGWPSPPNPRILAKTPVKNAWKQGPKGEQHVPHAGTSRWLTRLPQNFLWAYISQCSTYFLLAGAEWQANE